MWCGAIDKVGTVVESKSLALSVIRNWSLSGCSLIASRGYQSEEEPPSERFRNPERTRKIVSWGVIRAFETKFELGFEFDSWLIVHFLLPEVEQVPDEGESPRDRRRNPSDHRR